MVTAARTAGITDAQLRRMGAIVGAPGIAGAPGLGDGSKARKGPLSESGAEEPRPDGAGSAPSDPLGQAVLQMSQILAKLSAPKKSDLEDLLSEDYAVDGKEQSGSLPQALQDSSRESSDPHRLFRATPCRGLPERSSCAGIPKYSGLCSRLARASQSCPRHDGTGALVLASGWRPRLPPVGEGPGSASSPGPFTSCCRPGSDRCGVVAAVSRDASGAGASSGVVQQAPPSRKLGRPQDQAARSSSVLGLNPSHPRARSLPGGWQEAGILLDRSGSASDSKPQEPRC